MDKIVLAVFASSGFWVFVQYLIDRRDGIKKELELISTQIKKIDDKVDENAAVLARTHILRFENEMQNGIKHSQEYFHQQLEDIDTYEDFCRKHPDFKNSNAVIASEHIRETYKRLLDKREFGTGGKHDQ